MATIRQFYGSPGAPLTVEADPGDVVVAWHSQRARMHAWLAALPDDAWGGPTRCAGWDTSLLVRHLGSATQFLGYTLAQASEGTATTLLQGMDTRTTVASAAELLGDQTPGDARAFLTGTDGAVDTALDRLGPSGLEVTAESPAGHVPVHLSLTHFLFDSWVHEYDLLVPRGERPVVDPLESRVVAGYLTGLASLSWDGPTGPGTPVPLDLRLSDPDLRIGVEVRSGITTVTPGVVAAGAAVVEGRTVDVVDRMTGREGGPVDGDADALAVLDRFALVLST